MARQSALPSRSLLDPRFVYVSAVATDIRVRFRSVRAALAKAERRQAEAQQALDLGFDTPAPRANSVVVQLRPPAKRKAPARRAA